MRTEITIQTSAIQEADLIRNRPQDARNGAVVYFLGVVRDQEGRDPIAGLRYEAFEAMARHQFDLILQAVASRWPVQSVRVVHRIGLVRAGEPSLWVEVIAPHRAEALASCGYLIDEMKRLVPIWKHPIKQLEHADPKTAPSSAT